MRYEKGDLRMTPKFWICTTEEMELLFNETRKPVKRGVWDMVHVRCPQYMGDVLMANRFASLEVSRDVCK